MLQLYVARDRDGSLFLYGDKPTRNMHFSSWDGSFIKIEDESFPNLDWKDEPQLVNVTLN
jgi:hypothetical protein